MRKTALTALALIVAATALTVAQRADSRLAESPDVVLKTAVNRELVEGDLAAAVRTYREIATRYGSTAPALAAKALVQLAASYEKLGRPDARATYEEIIRTFPDQQAAVALARTRLGGTASQASETEMIVRQVWSGIGVNLEGQPSADGRLITFVDWTSTPQTGNVAVRDLTTGVNRRLTQSTSFEKGHADVPVLSPDGKQVAYAWADLDIRLVGSDGSPERVLVKDLGYTTKLAWSPDGRRIAATVNDRTSGNRIVIVSVADGSVTTLKSTEWRSAVLGGFSPDGRFLVFSLPNTAPAVDGGIFAIAVDGSRQTTLVQGPSDDSSPTWAPDGRHVVFSSDRSGARGLWSIRVDNASPLGSPQLLRKDIGEFNMGFSRDGSFFYGASNTQRDAYIAAIDPDTLDVTAQPKRLSEHFVGSNFRPTWSPDGRSIAFVRGSGREQRLVVRTVSDGRERALPTSLNGPSDGPEWFPDSRSVLVSETDYPNRRVIFRRIDVETGRDFILFESRPELVRPPVRVSPDGKSVYYSSRRENNLQLMRRDVETGIETELHRDVANGTGFFGLAVAPGGAQLAFSFNVPEGKLQPGGGTRSLVTMPAAGGSPRELYRGPATCPSPFAGAWAKDSRYVLGVCEEDGQRRRIWAFPVKGGEPRKLNLTMQDISGIDVSPDGGGVAFTGRVQNPEIWMIKNLFSGSRTSP